MLLVKAYTLLCDNKGLHGYNQRYIPATTCTGFIYFRDIVVLTKYILLLIDVVFRRNTTVLVPNNFNLKTITDSLTILI